MLCKTEERRIELLMIANKLVPFVFGWLRAEDKEGYCGSIRLYGELDRYEEHYIDEKNRSDKKAGKLFVLTSRTFLGERLKFK